MARPRSRALEVERGLDRIYAEITLRCGKRRRADEVEAMMYAGEVLREPRHRGGSLGSYTSGVGGCPGVAGARVSP